MTIRQQYSIWLVILLPLLAMFGISIYDGVASTFDKVMFGAGLTLAIIDIMIIFSGER